MNRIIIGIAIILSSLSFGVIAETVVSAPVSITAGPDKVYSPSGTVTVTKGTYGDYYDWDVPVSSRCYATQPTGINANLLGTFNVNVGGTTSAYHCYSR